MSELLEQARARLAELVAGQGLAQVRLEVTTRTLSTEEAIGRPQYDDLPILRGKEVIVEARFRGARGHAFTDEPSSWSGALEDLLALPLARSRERALLIAGMNAVLRALGLVDRTVHCRNDDISRCGQEMAAQLAEEHGEITVGVVGYQPGLVAGLVAQFGAARVGVTDLAVENVGRVVEGVRICDGRTHADELVALSDLVLATGSTAANGTLDHLHGLCQQSGIPLILYGVTAAGLCHLCRLPRICLRAS